MNTDFRVSVDFFTHHKARKLKKRLGAAAVSSLLQLWAYAAKLRTDGNLSGMSVEDIELAAEWNGEEGAFTATLFEVGFLDQDDAGIRLHDWDDHNAWVADADDRSDKARFSRLAQVNPQAHAMLKAQGINAVNREEYETLATAKRTPATTPAKSGDRPANASAPLAPSPSPAPTHVDKDSSLRSESCTEQPEVDSMPDAPVLDAVITLPLNTGKEHPVTRGEIDQWQDLYPAVDVLQALRNMRGWLTANQKRRKTKTGIGRFIQSWLAKEQDKGGRAVSVRDGPIAPRTYAQAQDYDKRRQGAEALEIAKKMKGFTPCGGYDHGDDANDLRANQAPQRGLPAGDIGTVHAGDGTGVGR